MEIPLGMLFKKMFCCNCGGKLQKKKISKIYFKGDEEFKRIKYGHTVILDKKQRIDNIVYYCPNCNSEITYDEQCVIAKRQKKLKKKILDENEVNP